MFRFASEVAGLSHSTVVLAQRFVKEDTGPIARSKLGLTNELNASRLDSVHIDAFADDEGVRVLRQDVGGGCSTVDAGLGQPPCDHGGHVVVVERAAAG